MSHAAFDFKKHFNLSGSLYCLSALSIIWGLCQVMSPILMTEALWEKTLCLGSLSIYELLLLGMYAYLLLKRRLKANSLIVILGLFFMSGGLVLNSLAGDDAVTAIYLGTGLIVLAGVKLRILHSQCRFKLSALQACGLLILSCGTFIMPGFMANIFDGSNSVEALWRQGFIFILAGLLCCWLPQAGIQRDSLLKKIFTGQLLIVSLLNMWALSYVFSVTKFFGDFLPLICLGCFLFIHRARKKTLPAVRVAIFIPLFLTISALTRGIYGPGLMAPELLLSLCAGYCFYLACIEKSDLLAYAAILYLTYVGYSLLFGEKAPFATAFLALFAVAVARICWVHKFAGALGFAALLIYKLAGSEAASIITAGSSLNQIEIGMLLCGLGIVAVNRFRYKLPQLDIAGAALCCWSLFTISYAWMIPAALCCLALAWLTGIKLREYRAALIFLLPLIRFAYYMLQNLTGWHFVIFSFVLLGAGTWLNSRRQSTENDDQQPAAAETKTEVTG